MNLVTAALLLLVGSDVFDIKLFRVDAPVWRAAVLGIFCNLFDVEFEGLGQVIIRTCLENLGYETGLH